MKFILTTAMLLMATPILGATFTFNSSFIFSDSSHSQPGSFVAFDDNNDGFINLTELTTMDILYSSGPGGGPSSWAFQINLGFLTSFNLNLTSLLTSVSTQYPSGSYIDNWTTWRPAEMCSLVGVDTRACPPQYLIPGPDEIFLSRLGDTSVTVQGSTDPSPVPLPAGGMLLLSGLGAIAALRRRKKHTA